MVKKNSITSIVECKYSTTYLDKDSGFQKFYSCGFEIYALDDKIILSLKTEECNETIRLQRSDLRDIRDCLDDYLKDKRV